MGSNALQKNQLKKKKNKDGNFHAISSSLVQNEEHFVDIKKEKKRKKNILEMQNGGSKDEHHLSHYKDGEKKKGKLSNQKKRRMRKPAESSIDDQSNGIEDGLGQENAKASELENTKSNRKKRKSDKTSGKTEKRQRGKSKEAHEIVEKDRPSPVAKNYSSDERGHAEEEEEIYELSSGDEDRSKGMRKWVTNYYQSRQELEVLQERIDEFITSYEEEKEQERKKQKELAAEGGWTVVEHHKGRKKTTDSETGITVGSVSQTAVIDNMANKKKKNKNVELDFYRFQKREAKRNEIMVLQSKFEEDKKRIQQLRAARKFRPY